jgi:putative intracellular protease/amidase
VVVDRHFVSSRRPADLPAFMAAVCDVLAGVAAT